MVQQPMMAAGVAMAGVAGVAAQPGAVAVPAEAAYSPWADTSLATQQAPVTGDTTNGDYEGATRPGDWRCPSENCQVNLFASRAACTKCGTPRPWTSKPWENPPPPKGPPPAWGPPPWQPGPEWGGFGPTFAQPAPPQGNQTVSKKGWITTDNRLPPGGPPFGMPKPPPPHMGGFKTSHTGMKPGDWMCPDPKCHAHNFASRGVCFKCSTKRPVSSGPAVPFSSMSKPGDWDCPSCQTMNFASRGSCFKCQKPKPGGMIGTHHKEGDW